MLFFFNVDLTIKFAIHTNLLLLFIFYSSCFMNYGSKSNQFINKAFGSWFYLQGKLPSSGSSTGMKFGTDSTNAIQYAKHEDVDTNPMEPTKVILANQLQGVFEFEFDLNFDSDGAFSSATSGFQITKRLTTNQVGDPDNVEWAADGSFFVNSDNNAGDITHIQTNGVMTKIAQTVNSGERYAESCVALSLDARPDSVFGKFTRTI